VQLWLGDQDTTVPYASNAGVVRGLLQPPAEFHSAPGAAHFSFLTPCDLLAPPMICKDPKGFDRKAFHAQFNREVLNFFRRKMPAGSR
jgi:predicted dienelactone hydrolase